MAGTAAAVDYFAWVGATLAACRGSRRQQIVAAMDALFDYEAILGARLVEGLQQIPGVRVLGITEPAAMERRVPTVAFVHDQTAPADIAHGLAERNIFAWSGHNYALELARALGIEQNGGAVRLGPVHYNTVAEIDVVLDAVESLVAR